MIFPCSQYFAGTELVNAYRWLEWNLALLVPRRFLTVWSVMDWATCALQMCLPLKLWFSFGSITESSLGSCYRAGWHGSSVDSLEQMARALLIHSWFWMVLTWAVARLTSVTVMEMMEMHSALMLYSKPSLWHLRIGCMISHTWKYL